MVKQNAINPHKLYMRKYIDDGIYQSARPKCFWSMTLHPRRQSNAKTVDCCLACLATTRLLILVCSINCTAVYYDHLSLSLSLSLFSLSLCLSLDPSCTCMHAHASIMSAHDCACDMYIAPWGVCLGQIVRCATKP